MVGSMVDLTWGNHNCYKSWEKLHEIRNFEAIVSDFSLFWLTYCFAAKDKYYPSEEVVCYNDGSKKMRIFSQVSKTFGLELQRLVKKIWEHLRNGLKQREKETRVFVRSFSGDEVVITHDEKKWSSPYYSNPCSKSVYDSYVFPVLPKLGELLGTEVFFGFYATYHYAESVIFGDTATKIEMVAQVTFKWNRVTLLAPRSNPELFTSDESWEDDLLEYQRQGNLCDATLKMEGREVKIHALVVHKKGCAHLLEGGVLKVDVSKETFDEFLDFLYLDSKTFIDKMRFCGKEESIPHLAEMAHRTNIPQLMKCCAGVLNYFVTSRNLVELKAVYSKYDDGYLNAVLRN